MKRKSEAGFTMNLTDEQIVDAIRIHRDECAHCNRVILPNFDQLPEKKLNKLLKRILREPAVIVMLARRYYPEESAALEAATLKQRSSTI
jgi:hypothetical protein